ncbi:MAG: hypothetical protein R2712_25030 [Vicinamibacterales bacterium]
MCVTTRTASSDRRRAVCRRLLTGLLLVCMAAAAPVAARAETRWAVIVSGASGGDKCAEQMEQWRAALQTALVERHGFDAGHVRVLVDESVEGGKTSSAANVTAIFDEIRKTSAREDMVLLVLLGHGTYDGNVAKFNLVGRDLTADEWNQMLSGVAGRLIVVNTTEASFPFLDALKAKGRVVITATNSAAQKYATVFPEYFVKALGEASTDLDKNGRTSVFEVFEATSVAVKQHYEQRGQLTTERALLDDNGDGQGAEQGGEGPDGSMARLWNTDAEPVSAADNPELISSSPAAPHAGGQGRGAQAAEGRHARRRVAGGLREAHDRARARLTGDPPAQLKRASQCSNHSAFVILNSPDTSRTLHPPRARVPAVRAGRTSSTPATNPMTCARERDAARRP